MRGAGSQRLRQCVCVFVLGVSSVALAADSGLDPGRLEVKFYELWVSKTKLCTDPVRVFSKRDAEYADMLLNPTLGSGPIDDGTYECVIVVFSDTMRWAPAASSTSGHCVEGTMYTGEICHDGDSALLPDGTTVECANDRDDRVAAYLSTGVSPTAAGRSVWQPPESEADAVNGLYLEGALVVDGNTTGTFYNDAMGAVFDNGESCEMMSSRPGFR